MKLAPQSPIIPNYAEQTREGCSRLTGPLQSQRVSPGGGCKINGPLCLSSIPIAGLGRRRPIRPARIKESRGFGELITERGMPLQKYIQGREYDCYIDLQESETGRRTNTALGWRCSWWPVGRVGNVTKTAGRRDRAGSGQAGMRTTTDVSLEIRVLSNGAEQSVLGFPSAIEGVARSAEPLCNLGRFSISTRAIFHFRQR